MLRAKSRSTEFSSPKLAVLNVMIDLRAGRTRFNAALASAEIDHSLFNCEDKLSKSNFIVKMFKN